MKLWIIIGITVALVIILIVTSNRRHITQKQASILTDYFSDVMRMMRTPNDKYLVDKNLNNIPIYVINLPRSKERLQNVREQQEYYGVKNLHIVEAVDGRRIRNKKEDIITFDEGGEIKFKNNDDAVSLGEIGCTLSHLKTIKHCYDKGYDYVLILEDDISFAITPLWDKPLIDILNSAPAGWEFLALYLACSTKIDKTYINYQDYQCWGMVAYIINKKGCETLLRQVYDTQTQEFILDKNITNRHNIAADLYIPYLVKAYCYHKSLFTPLNNFHEMNSTIHTTHTQQHITSTFEHIKPLYASVLKKAKIPKILHIIWIGDKLPPLSIRSWTVDFVKTYPDWIVKTWNDSDIKQLGLINQRSYDMMKEWCGKADVARYEILYRYGGMYMDADTVWLGNPIHPDLISGLFNVFRERPDCIANTWFSCVPNHPFLKQIINAIPERVDKGEPAWISTGPKLLHKIHSELEEFLHPNDIHFCEWDLVICPGKKSKTTMGWHGINDSNVDKILSECKTTKALCFHWGLSTNKFHASSIHGKQKDISGSNLVNIKFPTEEVDIFVQKDSSYLSHFRELSTHETKLRGIVRSLIAYGDISKNIIDCGAYIGDNALPWASLISGDVYAFDPCAKKCQFLEKVSQLNEISNLKIFQTGLSDKKETIITDDNYGFNVSYLNKSSGKGASAVFETLDSLYKNGSVTNVDFVHLDVEGYENKVLIGATEFIRDLKPLITVEIHPHHLELGDCVQVLNTLENMGYDCYVIDEICGDVKTCRNVLCIPFGKIIRYDLKKLTKVRSSTILSVIPNQ